MALEGEVKGKDVSKSSSILAKRSSIKDISIQGPWPRLQSLDCNISSWCPPPHPNPPPRQFVTYGVASISANIDIQLKYETLTNAL